MISTCACMHICLHARTCAERAATRRMDVPELHLDQAELLEVRAQLEGPENGILLGQHDQRGAGQAAVDVQAEPEAGKGGRGGENAWEGNRNGKRAAQMREREKKKNPEPNIQPPTGAASYVPALTPLCCSPAKLQTDSFSYLCGRLQCPAGRIKLAGRGESAISDLQLRGRDGIRIQHRLCSFHLKVLYVRILV